MACPRRPLKALYWSPYPSVRVSLKWTNLRPRSKLRHTLGGHTLPSLVDHKCSSSPLNNSLWYEHNNGKDFICPRAGISFAFAGCAQISCIISVHLFHLHCYCSANASVDNVEMIAAEEGSRPSLSWLWLPVRCPCPPLIDHCCYLAVVMMRMRMVMRRIITCTSHCNYTGSFRKNGKSKTIFMGTKFHEKLIFSAFFSRELATNLCSWATRSVTITLWHPEKVAPPVWFQALVGWLRLTIASTP